MTRTRYVVAGWGDGELWTSDEAVLAHDFRFDEGAASLPPRAATGAERARGVTRQAAPMGDAEPPSGTLAATRARLDHGSVPTSRRRAGRRRPVQPQRLVARFEGFLAGEPETFEDVPLDLGELTAFQRSVAGVLQRIPRGEIVSYGELAALAGYPGAQRAAGTFCARNRFMFLLPCHRVVAAGGIGGYGSTGVGVKRRLLALEGVRL